MFRSGLIFTNLPHVLSPDDRAHNEHRRESMRSGNRARVSSVSDCRHIVSRRERRSKATVRHPLPPVEIGMDRIWLPRNRHFRENPLAGPAFLALRTPKVNRRTGAFPGPKVGTWGTHFRADRCCGSERYSSRSRISGSTARARRAGIQDAMRPRTSMVAVTPPRTNGSFGVAW